MKDKRKFIDNPIYDRLDELEKKINKLESMININKDNNQNNKIETKIKKGGRVGVYDTWPEERKTEFKNDVLSGMRHTELVAKYELPSVSVSRYAKAIKNNTFKK